MLIHGSGLVFRLAFMLLLLRLNTSAVLGHYGLLVAIEVVAIYFAGFELHSFTTRRYARRPSVAMLRLCAAVHQRMFYFSVPLASGIAVGALAFLRVDLPLGDVAAFMVVVASGVIAQEVIRYMVLVGRPAQAVLVTFLRGAAWQPLVVPFMSADASTIRATLIAWACVSAIGTLWGVYVMRHALGRRMRPLSRYLFHGVFASRSFYVVQGAAALQGNLERFVLQLLLGPSAVGVFTFFQTLANTLPALIQSAILNVSLGQLLTNFGQRLAGRAAYLRKLRAKTLRASLLIAVLICAVAVPIVYVTSRPEYLHALWILPVLLVGQIVLAWTQPILLALYGGHHDRTLLIVSLIGLSASLGLNYLMIDAFGLVGAVVAPVVIGAGLALARWQLMVSFRASGRL